MSDSEFRSPEEQGFLFNDDFGAHTAARSPRPYRRAERSQSSESDALPAVQPQALPSGPHSDQPSAQGAAQSSAPGPPHFGMLDWDRDVGWRLWDTAIEEVSTMTKAEVLEAAFPHELTIVEGCHLRVQTATSVAHPFIAEELDRLASNLAEQRKTIRTANNRRTPRIWSELAPDVDWADRPKDRDAEMWARYLLAKPRRLESCRRWPQAERKPPPERDEIMADVKVVRQYRSYPGTPFAMEFEERAKRRLGRAWVRIPHGSFQHAVSVIFGLGPQRKGWSILTNPYICDAYCVAISLETDMPRSLSNRQIKRICGSYFNGYPNQVRSDLRHHLVRQGKYTCTEVDRAFIKVVRGLMETI